MRFRPHPVCIAALLWCSIGLPMVTAQAQQGEPIGRVTALEGTVIVRRPGAALAARLSVQSSVYQEDMIQTLADSKVRLVLVDGTEVTLGPEGSLRLTEYVYAPQETRQHSVLQVFFGILRIVTEKLLPHGTFEVQTSNAVVAIRGTDWLAEVRLDATAVVVLQGVVTVTQARSDIGDQVVLTPGEGTDVRGAQAPTPPNAWGRARIEALLRATTLP